MKINIQRFCVATILAVALSLGIYGCESENEANTPDPSAKIAIVGPRNITLGELESEIDKFGALFTTGMVNGKVAEPGAKKIKIALLNRMIDTLVMEVEAEKEAITVSSKELEEKIKTLLGEYDNARLGVVLAENKMSFEDWKESLKTRIKIRKLLVKRVDSQLIIDEKEIKEYFEANAVDFKRPMQVRAQQIMVDNEAEAEIIRKRLIGRADFARIAKESSQSPDAVHGGDLGYFSRGQMPPEFEEAVFNLKKGEISEVIKSIYGFHIFKVTGKKKSRAMKYKEARDRIEKILIANKREEVFKHWIKEIKEGIDIQVHTELLPQG